MKRLATKGICWLCAGFAAAPGLFRLASAATAAPADPVPSALYDEGVRALAGGLPPVAALKLRAFLHLDLAPGQRRAGALLLVRALLAGSDAAKAQEVLDTGLPPPADAAPDPEVSFWRGQVQAAFGHWDAALACYTLAAQPSAASSSPGADLRAQARFGQGECLLVLDRPTEAADVFTPLCGHPLLGETARLRCAEIALSQGRLDDAALLLRADAAFDPAAARGLPDKERVYLLGRLRLAQREPVQAEAAFSAALAQPRGLSERLLVDLSWGLAQARLDQGKLDPAEDVLENLIEHYPRMYSVYLRRTFAWLETLYLHDPPPDLSDLRQWTTDDAETDRQALALLTLGHVEAAQEDTAHAEKAFVQLIEEFPDHQLHARALLDLAALRLQSGRPREARALLDQARPQMDSLERGGESGTGGSRLAGGSSGRSAGRPTTTAAARVTSPVEWRTEVDVLDARISLAEHDRAKAAESFTAVADRLKEGPQAEAAAFDAVLCWLRALDAARFSAAEENFRARFPGSPLNAEFALEEGLTRANQALPGDRVARQRATACLRSFVRDHPDHARACEARIALAELAFERPKPELAIAWHEIEPFDLRAVVNDGAAPTPAPDAERARADYLAIWLADAPGPARDEEKAISLSRKFLEARAGSPLAAEVRMKLGEIYFRRADYSDAQTQLEGLAENAPTSPLAESALYLAGMSAAASMSEGGLDKAVTLFDAAARRGGPLRLTARLRQADVYYQLDRGRDAQVLYDLVLKATEDVASLNDADLESRCAALGGRGRTLLSMAVDDPKLYADAVRTFDQLRNTPGASLLWRRQALTRKGQALEKMGEPDAALAAYDDALNAPEPAAGGGGVSVPDAPEWTWFYRAGNDAAHLLEARSQWAAAIAIYKKLAAADGPMKSEFENTLNRRRLEHFIWEE